MPTELLALLTYGHAKDERLAEPNTSEFN